MLGQKCKQISTLNKKVQITNEVKALKDRIQILDDQIKSLNDSGTFVNSELSEYRDSIMKLIQSPIKTTSIDHAQTDSLEDARDETLTNIQVDKSASPDKTTNSSRSSRISIKKPVQSTEISKFGFAFKMFKVKKLILILENYFLGNELHYNLFHHFFIIQKSNYRF